MKVCVAMCTSWGLILQRLCYLTILPFLCCTNSSIVINQYLNSNYFHCQWIGRKIRHWNKIPNTQDLGWNWMRRWRFFDERKYVAGKTFKRRYTADKNFFDWILIGNLSCWCNVQFICHSSESQLRTLFVSFIKFIKLWLAYSTLVCATSLCLLQSSLRV